MPQSLHHTHDPHKRNKRSSHGNGYDFSGFEKPRHSFLFFLDKLSNLVVVFGVFNYVCRRLVAFA